MSLFIPTYYYPRQTSCIISYDPELNEAIGFTPAVVKRWKRLLAIQRVFSARVISMRDKVREVTKEMRRLRRPGDLEFPNACRTRKTYRWMLQCLKRQLFMCNKAICSIIENADLPRYAYSSCRSLTSRVNALPRELQDLVFDHLLGRMYKPYVRDRTFKRSYVLYTRDRVSLQDGIKSHINLEVQWGDRMARERTQGTVSQCPTFWKECSLHNQILRLAWARIDSVAVEQDHRRTGNPELPYPVFDTPHFMEPKFAHPGMVAALVERARYKIARETARTIFVDSNALFHFGTARSHAFGVPLAGFYSTVHLTIWPGHILGRIRHNRKKMHEKDWEAIPVHLRYIMLTAAEPMERYGGRLCIRASPPRWDYLPGTFDTERYKVIFEKVIEELKSRKMAVIDFCWM